MRKYSGFIIVVTSFALTIFAATWAGPANAHKTGKEVRSIASCKILKSKRKYRACRRCLKIGLDYHYHPDRLFKRCMINGVKPFFRKGPPS